MYVSQFYGSIPLNIFVSMSYECHKFYSVRTDLMEAEPGQQSASSGSSQEDLETEDESSEHLHVNIEKPETSRHSSLSGSRSPNISQGWEARNTPPLQGVRLLA